MNRGDANAMIGEAAKLLVKARSQYGSDRRTNILMAATYAIQALAWAGIETQTRKPQFDKNDEDQP